MMLLIIEILNFLTSVFKGQQDSAFYLTLGTLLSIFSIPMLLKIRRAWKKNKLLSANLDGAAKADKKYFRKGVRKSFRKDKKARKHAMMSGCLAALIVIVVMLIVAFGLCLSIVG